MSVVLSDAQAMAKAIAAKTRLGRVTPWTSSFLQLFPVAISRNPKVFPAYIRPVPECVVAHTAVQELALSELSTILLHESLHGLFDVFGFMVGLDPELAATAHDLFINLLIDEEINRLNRLGLNGQDVQTAMLTWPRAFPPVLDYRFVGMTPLQIYNVLLREREEGKAGYPNHGDCPVEEISEEALQKMRAHLRMASLRAAQEASAAGGEEDHLQSLVFKLLRPSLPWRRVLMQRIGGVAQHLEERSFLALNPNDTSDEDGVLTPGVRMTGESILIAPDVSISTVAQGLTNRFVAEAQAAAEAFEGPVRLALWDTKVRVDVALEGRSLARQLQGCRGGGNTDVRCLLDHLVNPPAGSQEMPEPALVVILTDGRVESWPPVSAWPCEVLVAYTHQAPPTEYRSLLIEEPAA